MCVVLERDRQEPVGFDSVHQAGVVRADGEVEEILQRD